MPTEHQTLRVAILAWEIGRVSSGLGAKIGGLGTIIEELPAELVKTAQEQHIDLDIEILSPCFAHYDKRQLTRLDLTPQVTLGGHTFPFEVYEHVFDDGQRAIYFWDQGQLHWTNASAIYPSDPWLALGLYATVGQAMASYIAQGHFDTVHLHDYHVGLVPFYLGDAYLQQVPTHLTIHNASYQG
ncbi:MAG TPA: glycogen/starch synthase, partial [Candidatus Tectomicrobia bacterium]